MTIKKLSSIVAIFIIVVVIISVAVLYKQEGRSVSVNSPSIAPSLSEKPTSTAPTPSLSPSKLPVTTSSLSLAVPFTPQAPTGNWDLLHNEACEEASAIMVGAYFSGDTRKVIPAREVEKEISILTQWEESHFGYNLDTTALETAEMIRSVYGLKVSIVNNFTEKEIKEALSANKVIIIPVNGRKLGNPNYRQPGPIYHMLVVRGYTSTKIITNDSGTRNGENYSYLFSTIDDATADWDHTTNTIDESKSVMIIISK